MARRTSLIVAAAVLGGLAGCSSANPATTSSASEQVATPISSETTANEPLNQELSEELSQPITNAEGNTALTAGMAASTTPLVAGATAIPSLSSLAAGVPGPIPPVAMHSLEMFPTLAFSAFRYIDLYTPLFASSFRARVATLGLPGGLPLSIYSRLNFFGMHSYFGFYAPLYWWHGALQPLSLYNSMTANFTYPYLYSGPNGLAPFYYNSPTLLSNYTAPIGTCSVCTPRSALRISR